jgi:uncharacterized membrane protein
VKRIRTYIIAGLIVLVPIIVTWKLLLWFFNVVDGLLSGLVPHVFGRPIPGVGLVTTVLVVLLVGILAANLFGRKLIQYGESLIRRTPIVRSVYVTMKQITDAFVRQEQAAFSRVCLIEYPRKGIYSPGFVTSPAVPELEEKAKTKLIGVFVPTTPNPTSGFLLYVPAEDVIYLDLPVEDGLRLVISGGVITPSNSRPAQALPDQTPDEGRETAGHEGERPAGE